MKDKIVFLFNPTPAPPISPWMHFNYAISAVFEKCADAFSDRRKRTTENHLEMVEAMRQFCARCDEGSIRSVNTYAKFKALLREYDAIQTEKMP